MGFLKFLMQTLGRFLGLLVGIIGFIWVIAAIGAGDWLAALPGVPVLLLGAWLHFRDFDGG